MVRNFPTREETMTERERVRRRLRRKFTRMLADCEQAIRDIHYWADINPAEEPLDCEWFVVQAAGVRKCLGALERDEYIDPSWLQNE